MVFNYYKNKFFINIGIILVFFSLIAVFIIYPAVVEISRVNKEITDERIKLEKKLALGLNIKKIIKDLEEIEGPAKQLDTIFIAKGTELDLVNQLELISNKHDVGLELSSDFIGKTLELGISQVEIQLIVTGEYRQIINFIKEVEEMNSYLNIKSINFSKKRGTPSSQIVAQLIGNTYFK